MREAIHRRLFRLFLCALILMVVALSASAVERPFKLTGITQLTGNPFAPEGAGMVGAGTATHLGNWTNTGSFFLEPNLHGYGAIDLVAANGDHLNFTAEGNADPSFNVVATYSITGGTGRFAGASGTGDFVGHLNPQDFVITYTATGTIDY